jgi:hypothetical protein
MLEIGFYVRDGNAYLPQMARTEAGFYLDTEPVEVAAVNNTQQLASALQNLIARGNPVVPTPSRRAFPRPVVLRYAKVRSWKQFEKGSAYWMLSKRDDGWTFGPWKRADRGWEPDQTALTRVEAMQSVERIVQLLISSMQQHIGGT